MFGERKLQQLQLKTIICVVLLSSFLIYKFMQMDTLLLKAPLLKHGIITPQSSATHILILITDNSQFNSTNGVSAGNGSSNNPYIIENWFN